MSGRKFDTGVDVLPEYSGSHTTPKGTKPYSDQATKNRKNKGKAQHVGTNDATTTSATEPVRLVISQPQATEPTPGELLLQKFSQKKARR